MICTGSSPARPPAAQAWGDSQAPTGRACGAGPRREPWAWASLPRGEEGTAFGDGGRDLWGQRSEVKQDEHGAWMQALL